jgi:hypothetical protein
MNVHAPKEDNIYYMKAIVYDEIESIFHSFPKCRMKILLGDLNANVGREDIQTNNWE